MDEIIQDIKKFADHRIWMTKKTRMESEARLKKNQNLSNIIINYYTFAVLAFSIWSLVLNPESSVAKYVTLMTVISSVGLFGVTLLISSLGYRERALQFKESYNKLDRLESEFQHLLRSAYKMSKDEVIEKFHIFEKEYFDILALSDNHEQIDNSKVMIDRELPGYQSHVESYKNYARLRGITLFALFAVPLILVIILICIPK